MARPMTRRGEASQGTAYADGAASNERAHTPDRVGTGGFHGKEDDEEFVMAFNRDPEGVSVQQTSRATAATFGGHDTARVTISVLRVSTCWEPAALWVMEQLCKGRKSCMDPVVK
eukprot:2357255-Rhodomonas_salina.5